MSFRKDFVWGAATAAYQIEGAAYEDGKGLSTWDVFCRAPGKIWEGCTGEVACDHYHRYKEDVAAMKAIGLKAYRLSLSWPRLLPEGVGRPNEQGLAFYDALIDELLAAGITPWVTLFHWDYPYELFYRGGWLNPDSPGWFAEYAGLVVKRYSDRVSHWMTINEPQVFLQMGHADGSHAPGLQLDWPELLRAAHHVLLAHGRAVQVLRSGARTPPSIGFAPVGETRMPATDRPEDIAAAGRAMFAVNTRSLWSNAWFSDPIFFGHYPEDGLASFGAAVPSYNDADMKTISEPLDFYGMNTYRGEFIRADAHGAPELVPLPNTRPHSLFYWQITPAALYWGPRFFYERYHQPIVVTENGVSNTDWVHLDGRIHDLQRIDFTRRYLRQLARASEEGIPVLGYFHWSLMDNFEWAEGYRQRFGLVYVDYATQKRVPKDSAEWYAKLIDTNGRIL
jgi:beta-glucosidase